MLRFQVLGRIAADNERGEIPLGSARQRAVLAVLLVAPGVVVPVDQLVDRVWGEAAPRRARETLHSYVSRLRGVLGGAALIRRAGGYTVDAAESVVDIHEFRALVARARQAGTGDDAVGLWREAMALWRGEPFSGVDNAWLRQVARGWESERAAALLDYRDVRLSRGEHAVLLPELTAAADESAWDERVVGQVMLALYRCGRQADALARYRALRERLVEEVGSEPGAALRELHQRMLRQDPALAVAPPVSPPAVSPPTLSPPAVSPPAVSPPADPPDPAPVAVPAQLPADVAGFTGRDEDLRRLDELSDGGHGQAVVVTAIGGTAGVGKTALAVHWAHRVADRFPDGQLYVNLRGYDPGRPMDPGEALAGFLAALGVRGPEIPLGLEERAARFRSAVAGRRMLVVLDNAGSVAQVRPLLPGSGSCVVVVTSRDSLAGLVAVDGARRVDVGVLSGSEAVGLLRRLVGDRVGVEPEAAVALSVQCARLPLALRVAAELAVSRPDSGLGDLVAELADRQARLELLVAGDDPRAAVREVFSWSVQQLSAAAAGMFALLGSHPGPDFDPYAVAALSGTELGQARRLLERLVRASLIQRAGRDRYGMHDLLRAYAAESAAAEDTERQAAQQRLLGYYQCAAAAAMTLLYPAEARYWPEVPAATGTLPEFASPADARAWLDTERSCLVATVAHAAATGHTWYASGTPQILHRYLNDAYLADQLAMDGNARRAAEAAGDTAAAAHALRRLATAYNQLGQYERAVEHGQAALERSRKVGDLIAEALSLSVLGIARYRLGEHKQALDDDTQAAAVFRRAGDRLGEAGALLNLAVDEEQLGRYGPAADYSRRALAIFRDLGSRYYEGLVLNNLGNTEVLLGEYESAGEHLQQSLDILREVGSPITRAHGLDSLGGLHVRCGEHAAAVDCFEEALALYRQVGDRTGQAWSTNGLGEASRLAGRPADALVHHTEALALATETRSRHQAARAHAGIGHAHRELGDHGESQRHFALAYAIYTELEMPVAEEIRPYLDPPRQCAP